MTCLWCIFFWLRYLTEKNYKFEISEHSGIFKFPSFYISKIVRKTNYLPIEVISSIEDKSEAKISLNNPGHKRTKRKSSFLAPSMFYSRNHSPINTNDQSLTLASNFIFLPECTCHILKSMCWPFTKLTNRVTAYDETIHKNEENDLHENDKASRDDQFDSKQNELREQKKKKKSFNRFFSCNFLNRAFKNKTSPIY